MEELYGLVEWKESLESVGFAEYFEAFFDQFPYEGVPYPNDAMTEAEREAVHNVHRLMIDASNAAPKMMTEEHFIATGWPQRIEPIAEQALLLMLKRGRFSEEHEEGNPSCTNGWPWRERFSCGE